MRSITPEAERRESIEYQITTTLIMSNKQPTTHQEWWDELRRDKDTEDEANAVNKAYTKWLEKNPRKYTLNISMVNEQTGVEGEWGGKSITFYNEDNAINHLSLLESFFELLLENKDWGYQHTTEETVANILNPIKVRLEGKQ